MERSSTGLLFFSFIAVAAALISCAKPPAPGLGPTPTLAPAPTSILTPKGSLPLVDAHNHLPRGVTIEQVIKFMDEAGVRATTLMPVYYGGNQAQGQGISDENLVLEFYKKHPDRIIPILGMQRPYCSVQFIGNPLMKRPKNFSGSLSPDSKPDLSGVWANSFSGTILMLSREARVAEQ